MSPIQPSIKHCNINHCIKENKPFSGTQRRKRTGRHFAVLHFLALARLTVYVCTEVTGPPRPPQPTGPRDTFLDHFLIAALVCDRFRVKNFVRRSRAFCFCRTVVYHRRAGIGAQVCKYNIQPSKQQPLHGEGTHTRLSQVSGQIQPHQSYTFTTPSRPVSY